jgi:PAS domain S-box-containing protein
VTTESAVSRFPGDAVLELQRLSARISSELTPAEAARAVLDHAVSALGALRAHVILLDAHGALESIVSLDRPETPVSEIPADLVGPVAAVVDVDEAQFLGTDAEITRRYPILASLRQGNGSVASMPLVSSEHRLGMLFLVFDPQGPFSPSERQLLLGLADTCAGVIERARLAEAERLARARLDFLADASRSLAESLDLRVTLETAAQLAIPILADGAILDLQTEGGRFERVVSLPPGSSADAETLRANTPVPSPGHPSFEAMAESRTIRYEVSDELIERMTRNEAHRAAAHRARGRFALAAPLMLGSEPFGTITLYRSNAGPYSDEEVRVAEEFARRAARAIENSRLHSEHQRSLAQANALVRLNAAAADARSPDEVGGLLLDATIDILGGRRGVLFEFDAVAREFIVTRTLNYMARPGDRVAVDGRPGEQALRTGETVVGTREEWGGAFDPFGSDTTTTSAAFVVAPLIVGGEQLGVVSVGFDEPHELPQSVLATFRGLIDAGAQAIARATLLDSQRRLLERESAVARVNEAVAEARGPDDVARVLLSAVFERLSPRSASVALLDEAADEFVLAGILTGPDASPTAHSRWPANLASPARDVVRSRATLILDAGEYRDRYPEITAVSEPAGMGMYVALPLVSGTRAIGALALTFTERRAFATTEVEDLRAMAEAGGEAIERARLREGERRALGLLEAVVSGLPVGVVIVDATSGRVLHANTAVAELLGRQPRIGSAIDGARTQLKHPDGAPIPAPEAPLARAVREGVAVGPMEVVLIREDGGERRVLLDALPVRDDAGRLLAAAGTWTDITERRSAEAAREAFLGVLSHELRTPITSILAGSGILARRDLGPEEAGLVLDINAESERLHRLVEDLLVLSRVERGADLRRADPVLIQHVARRVMAHEASRWPDRRFEASIPTGLAAASGDEAYVEQVIRNLLSNAAKYGPAGDMIELVVDGETDGVAIRVLDHGPGFADDDVAKVFELFYRAPSAAKVAAGAGIGLFTARVLTEAMGGRIWAANRPAGGAEVGVVLPFATWETDT